MQILFKQNFPLNSQIQFKEYFTHTATYIPRILKWFIKLNNTITQLNNHKERSKLTQLLGKRQKQTQTTH